MSKIPLAGHLLFLALAACAPGASDPAPAAPDSSSTTRPPPDDDDLAARAAAAGLTSEQAQQLVALGVPVMVPVLPEGWTSAGFEAAVDVYDGFRYPYYRLDYDRADGACFGIGAASEGLGDVFLSEPPRSREVAVPGVATYGPVLLGWAEAGEAEEEGGAPYLRSEWFGADGLAVSFGSGDDGEGACRRVTPDEAAALLASFRYLDPADDALALGPLAFVDLSAMLADEPAGGTTPEDAAARLFARAAGEGDAAPTVERLRQRPTHAVVLVTNTNPPGDAIRDERVRALLVPGDGGWRVTEAGRQVRCREGRGHADWSPAPCG